MQLHIARFRKPVEICQSVEYFRFREFHHVHADHNHIAHHLPLFHLLFWKEYDTWWESERIGNAYHRIPRRIVIRICLYFMDDAWCQFRPLRKFQFAHIRFFPIVTHKVISGHRCIAYCKLCSFSKDAIIGT